MKNYNEMNMEQTSQEEAYEQEYDGIDIYCLIGMICSIIGSMIMLFVHLIFGLCIGIVGITLSAVGLYMHNRTRKNLSGKVFGKVGIIVPIACLIIVIALYVFTLIYFQNRGGINAVYRDLINAEYRDLMNEYMLDQGSLGEW